MESVLCAVLSLEPLSPERMEQRRGQHAGWASSIREMDREEGGKKSSRQALFEGNLDFG